MWGPLLGPYGLAQIELIKQTDVSKSNLMNFIYSYIHVHVCIIRCIIRYTPYISKCTIFI